jgi:hypothetical protein
VAEGGYFGGDAVRFADEDYAEVCAYGEGFFVREESEDDVGRGAGGYVEVLGFKAQENVAYAASGEVGLMACGTQGMDDISRCNVPWASQGVIHGFIR